MCSRVEVDASGRRIVVVTTAGTPGLPIGSTFVMIGDSLPCGEVGFSWTGQRSGFRNTVTAPRRNNRDPIPVDA